MSIKILHTGDLHIGNFPGPEEKGENVRLKDIRKCLDTIVSDAWEIMPDAVIVAGDVFHQARVWADRGLKENKIAVDFLRSLSEICPVVVIRGTANHDSAEQFESLKATFSYAGNVKIVTEPQVVRVQKLGGERVNIACLPGFDRGYFRAKNPGLSKEEENEAFTKAIEDLIYGLKAQCPETTKAVLVSHYTIAGCNMESGQTPFFSQFEPVVYPQTLQAAGFDLACFGHIHRPQKVDGCGNTYYCGAISALNFNDEGQERGYWVHEIGDGGETVSEFRRLPTRKYLTIRMDDDDVEKFLEEADTYRANLPDVKDKVVRVLYDCTDEHNKAFNHAAYENMLYAAGGAFFVQEITPQKITITADRRSMEAADTPEDNLLEYLEEKELPPEKVGYLLELARPIISEAVEKTTVERRTGLFVPVEIEVKNYRNYRNEKFSFDGIRFCTINGENGVGKSSLFMDAIVDALFEETREGDLTGWICNSPDARSGAIKLTFRIGESLYRVTRTRQKSGKATLNIAEFVDGEWEDRSKEKYRDTQAEIVNIIGIDSLTLKSCALIMQDQYGIFLQADKEARMNILGNILGLSVYTAMEELAAEKLTDVNRAIRRISDKVDVITAEIPDGFKLQEEIDGAEAKAAELKEKEQRITESVDRLKVMLNTQIDAAERAMKINGRLADLYSKQALKQGAKTSQTAVLVQAESVLTKEQEILNGVKTYNELVEQEKERIKEKAAYDSLFEKKKDIEKRLRNAKAEKQDAARKLNALFDRITPLVQELEKEQELNKWHMEYEKTKKKATEMEELAPVWKEKHQAVLDAEKEAESMTQAWKEETRQFQSQYDTLLQKVSLLADSGCPDPDNAHCKFLSDALEAKGKLPEVESRLKMLRNETPDAVQNAINTLSEAQNELGKVLYAPDDYESLMGKLKALEPYEKKYEALNRVESDLKSCREREQELEAIEEKWKAEAEKAETELAETETKIKGAEEANTKFLQLQADIEKNRAWLDREKQLPVEKERKAAALARIAEIEAEIETIEAEIADNKADLEKERSAASGKDELQKQVDDAENEIRILQAEERETSVTIGRLKQKQELAREKLKIAKELQGNVNVLGIKSAGYEALKKAFSQDGIPHNIIRSIIPAFEATASNILGQMSGGKMSVEFVTEKVLKSNSKKEVTTLDIIINDCNTGRLPYMSRSGGEKVKSALSVVLALSEIKQSQAGIKFGFLFIDEPSFLDATGMQAYCDALEAIQARYPEIKIIAITHDPAMKSRFPQSVDIVKTPEGSRVVYE